MDEAFRKRSVFPLHLHWDGSIPAEALFAQAQRQHKKLLLPEKDSEGRPLAYASEEERMISSPIQLQQVLYELRKYAMMDVFGIPIGLMQSPDALHEAAFGLCAYLQEQHVPYAEVRFAPQYHTSQLSLEDVPSVAADAFLAGKEQTGVDVRLIISIDRASSPDVGVGIARAAVAANKRYPLMILGIDLACEENTNPPEKHYAAFRETFDTPLKRTVHAGEMCTESINALNMCNAIAVLRADGIAHALQLYKYPPLIKRMAEQGIRLESNPICNKFFFNVDLEELHLDELLRQGVLVTINPDDPAFIPDCSTHDNLYAMQQLHGPDFVDRVIENSIEAAWGLSRAEKDNYLRLVRQEAKEYRQARETASISKR
ncbi:MAG: hypothetical protein V1725_00710 [archaeon]